MEATPVKIYCEADGKTSEGRALRRDFSFQERLLRTAKVFGILFGIGLGTVVVPVLHFVLPPLFFLAACIFATTTWIETSEILDGEISCPNCGHKLIFPREAEEWPKIQRCGGCSYLLTIAPVKA